MCNCGNTITTNTICTTCVPTDCACPIKDFSTDCILYTGEDLPCTQIKQGTIMTELIGQLDTYLCGLSEQIANSFGLISIGTGKKIYRGIDGIGRKEIRTIDSIDNLITVGLSADDKKIDLSINQANFISFINNNQTTPNLQSVVNVGNTIVMPTNVAKGIGITLANLETVYQNGVSVTIPQQTGTPYPDYNSSPDAYVAKINGQTPDYLSGFVGGFVVNANGLDNIGFYADLQSDSGTSAGCVIKSVDSNTGDLFRGQKQIASVNSTVFKVTDIGDVTANKFIKSGGTSAQFLKADGSVDTNTYITGYSVGPGLVLLGNTINIENLQKTIPGADYTLLPADTEYTIFIDNGVTPMTITVPNGLPENFNVGFIQEGTGLVTFSGAGPTINTPTGLKIKGQSYQAFLEKKEATNTFYLLGNIIA